MFRRRGFNRPLGRPPVPVIPPALRRANELMSSGQFEEAAVIFEQFARGALQRGGPRAPQFFLQAGRCRILAGQVPTGMALIKQGLTIIANRGNWRHLQNAGQRITAELNQHQLKAESNEIETWLKQTIPAGFAAGAGAAGPDVSRRVLPTNCHGCGGPLHADEVEWTDEITAECPYCGSAVRVEG